jgi:hypothetical protein
VAGRKPKPPADRLSVVQKIPVTPHEKRAIERAAAIAGLTVSAYLRAAALRGPLLKPPFRVRALAMLSFELKALAKAMKTLAAASGDPNLEAWATFVGKDMIERAEGRTDLASLAEAIIPTLEGIGSKVEAMALCTDAQDDPSSRQVDGLLMELKDALEPLRQALKSPAPPAVSDDEGGSPIDLL